MPPPWRRGRRPRATAARLPRVPKRRCSPWPCSCSSPRSLAGAQPLRRPEFAFPFLCLRRLLAFFFFCLFFFGFFALVVVTTLPPLPRAESLATVGGVGAVLSVPWHSSAAAQSPRAGSVGKPPPVRAS